MLFLSLLICLSVPVVQAGNNSPSSHLTSETPLPDLLALSDMASTVFVGDVLSSRDVPTPGDEHTIASVVVTEVLRGEPTASVEFRTRSTELGEKTMMGQTLVQGYTLLVFLDQTGVALDGGVTLVEAGYVWRNKDPGSFLSPRLDRDWIADIDPSKDYTMWSLDEVRSAVDNPRKHRKKLFKKRDQSQE